MQVRGVQNYVEASANTGGGSSASASDYQLVNQTLTITNKTGGRFRLGADGTYLGIAGSTISIENANCQFYWKRDGVAIGTNKVLEITSENSAGSSGLLLRIPPGLVDAYDNPGAGTFVYTLWVSNPSADFTVMWSSVRINAYEMGT